MFICVIYSQFISIDIEACEEYFALIFPILNIKRNKNVLQLQSEWQEPY